MKNKAVARLLKQISRALASVTKAKSLALNLKGKISDIRAQMAIFSLLYLDKRSVLGPIRFNNLRTSLSHQHNLHQEPTNRGDDSILQDPTVAKHVNTEYLEKATVAAKQEEDLPESLLEELDFDDHDAGKSPIEMVGDYNEVEDGIDEVAEMFITRFYNQLRMQKQDSFKSLSRQDSFKSCLSKQNSFKSCSSPFPPQQMHQTS